MQESIKIKHKRSGKKNYLSKLIHKRTTLHKQLTQVERQIINLAKQSKQKEVGQVERNASTLNFQQEISLMFDKLFEFAENEIVKSGN